jgi:toxin-antitoxin system PIN domain toxin
MSQHEKARRWLDERLNGAAPVGLPWPSLLGFLRLITNPRIFERPRTMTDAWAQVKSWLQCNPVWIPAPTENHGRMLEPLLPAIGSRSNLVPDAHLAALALEHGLILCSTDGDFARFPGLRWENPLQ